MPECHRCYKTAIRCEVCKGEGKVPYMFGDCTECDGTGWVCPDHGQILETLISVARSRFSGHLTICPYGLSFNQLVRICPVADQGEGVAEVGR